MKRLHSIAIASAITSTASLAHAHVSIVSGNAAANATSVVRFGVGHGCAGADTYRVQIEVPAGVTSMRPMRSDFGTTSVQTDAAGTVTSVTWQRADADVAASDTNYYELFLRLRTPNAPFTTIYFPTHQTCRASDGTLSVTDWIGTPSTPVPEGGTAPEPAPELHVVPAHLPGWNTFMLATDIADLSVYFGDALIVWRDTAAYSVNPNTAQLITTTPGVTPLTALHTGDRISVRY